MRDELSEEEILKEALHQLSDACCFLYELESDEGKAMAYTCNAILKYGHALNLKSSIDGLAATLRTLAVMSKSEDDKYYKLLLDQANNIFNEIKENIERWKMRAH